MMLLSRSRATRTIVAVSTLAGMAVPHAPAFAGKQEAAVAQCAPQKAPASVQNWLAMEIPSSNANLNALKTNEALAFRLAAICATVQVDERRPGRTPNWKALRAALTKVKPSTTGAPVAEGVVELCLSNVLEAGQARLFKAEIAAVGETGRLIAFQQYFRFTDQWGAVPLPMDLRTVPPADAKIETTCKHIGVDGSLSDA